MARPQKKRQVCMEPDHFLFGPLGIDETDRAIVNLTVDEFECLRLIDIDKLTQEQVAEQMKIARPTVQRIYEEARLKATRMLVEGVYLQISGGNYVLCGDGCCRRGKRRDPLKQIKEIGESLRLESEEQS
jgi:uncharacterized protein